MGHHDGLREGKKALDRGGNAEASAANLALSAVSRLWTEVLADIREAAKRTPSCVSKMSAVTITEPAVSGGRRRSCSPPLRSRGPSDGGLRTRRSRQGCPRA